MGEQPHRELREELGPDAAAALNVLADEDAARLLTAVREARAAEHRALREAAESSLSFVPRFARGTVKKIVFGG